MFVTSASLLAWCALIVGVVKIVVIVMTRRRNKCRSSHFPKR
jgi:hypothetical protein